MYDESLGCLDKCLEIVPDDGAVLLQMANVYKNMEDYPKALFCIESALGKNPDDLMLKLSKYLMLSNMGEFEESLNGFRSIQINDLDNYGLISMYYIYYGCGLQNMGRYDDALRLYDEYLCRYGGFPKDEIMAERDRALGQMH